MGEDADMWRALREQKRQRKLADSTKSNTNKPGEKPKPRCWDWIIVNSNCHYAKNGSSFKDYRKIRATAGGMQVFGIGTVVLATQASRDDLKKKVNFTLHNVLHIPSAKCNAVNPLLEGGGKIEIEGEGHEWTGYGPSGGQLWYSEEFCGHQRMVLEGNPKGDSPIKEEEDMAGMQGTIARVSINITPEEQKEIKSQISKAVDSSTNEAGPSNTNANRCWDWIVISGHYSYAKDREAFTSYRPVDNMRESIIGIGTVKLRVRKSPGSLDTGELEVPNVLHMPKAICNGVQLFNIAPRMNVGGGIGGAWVALDNDNSPLCYATPFCDLRRLVLDKQPAGISELQEAKDKGKAFALSLYLDQEQLKALAEYETS